MTSHAIIPIPAGLHKRYNRDSAGRDWLASLPGLMAAAAERWDVSVDLLPGEEPWHGHGALVIPVLHAGHPAALKIAYPHDQALLERQALTLWDGHGAVRLIAADASDCSLLLERLDPDTSLQEASLENARDVWGGIVRELSITPDDRSEWRGLDHVAATAERWSDELPAEWERLGQPFPRWLLEAALEVCQTRGAVGRRSGKDVLVHTDLHFMNVLAAGDKAPRHSPYVAIDPQPQVGEAEFAVAPILWNRIADLPPGNPAEALRERCSDFSCAAGLDPEVARQWSIAREVENALSYTAEARTGDRHRSLWVASTLAGRTLEGLPSAHDLPGPGESD